jgi:small subunit ribosomal protein S16
MAVKLRLTRMGSKKSPFYRIVATDSRKSRDGQYIEQIGYYNPVKEPPEIKIDSEIAKKWLSYGAQPTDTVKNLLFHAGVIEGASKEPTITTENAEITTDEIKDTVDAAVKAHIAE